MFRALLACAFLSSATPVFADVWEYLKVTNTKENLSVEKLNELGQQCWELIGCPVDSVKFGHRIYLEEANFYPYAYATANYCIFKRRTSREGVLRCP